MTPDPTAFLDPCDVIDFQAPQIAQLAADLRATDAVETARRCFHFVRDEIKHSADFQLDPITCAASEVLAHRTGYCYAKSHLLCALLRANTIPAGLSYQRLSVDGVGAPYALHGLNAAFLPEFGWYRMDPRGNRREVDARFEPPHEQLAFAIKLPGEVDFPEIRIRPLPVVVDALRTYHTWQALGRHLPDQPA